MNVTKYAVLGSVSVWRRVALMLLTVALLVPLVMLTSTQQAEAYCNGSGSAQFNGSSGRADENSQWASTCDGDFRYYGAGRDDVIDSKNARVDGSSNGSNWSVVVNTGTDTNFWVNYSYSSTTVNTTYLRTCVQSALGSTSYVCGPTLTNKGY